ncbi:MAG: DNA mismatch repair endonuclease MutL [Clostridia bacterium]|nr:DNA mismatch repair endonuclease MutL [Clostridia bacterium]
MAKIEVLDFHVANLIAAGEVVERPASCVKELLENALDAGATEITVEIKRGGISFLRVSDNGCGMAREDLPVAIKRHATSKIRVAADLDGIMTLGFRGEALAAIASVSLLRIMTKREGDRYGSLLVSEYGKVSEVAEVGCKNGTTVIVENLFANQPARRKFLKRDASEALAVSSIVEKLAISRPDIAFKLIVDGNMKIATPGDKRLISAVYAALGKEFAERLVKVRNITDGIEVVGYISRPESVRANRGGQNFFINGRYVRSKTATAALEQAFDSYCETGKFPFCVLFISVHPTFVDVNVHPTKLEVKFSNERAVFDAVYCAVRNTLSDSRETGEPILEPRRVTPSERGLYNAFVPIEDRLADTPTKEIPPQKVFDEPTISDLLPPEPVMKPTVNEPKAEPKPIEKPIEQEIKPEKQDFFSTLSSITADATAFDVNPKQEASAPVQEETLLPKVEVKEEPAVAKPLYRIIGEAFHAYIMVEVGDVTLILDKHAAHERILFEKMKRNREKSRESLATQMLLVPLTLSLTPEERAALSEFEEDIVKTGFVFEKHDEGALVSGIPAGLSESEALDMLTKLCEQLAEGTGNVAVTTSVVYEKALYQASCKAAMKAGLIDTPENIKWLVETVLENPDIRYCPHGRPIAFELSRRDMEKFFKRT